MIKWLGVAAVAAFFLGSPASAQYKGLTPAEVAGVARTRALDLRIADMPSTRMPQLLVGGMLVSRELAPNAKVGLGLATIYGRKKNNADSRINGGVAPSRKPAVTFTLRF